MDENGKNQTSCKVSTQLVHCRLSLPDLIYTSKGSGDLCTTKLSSLEVFAQSDCSTSVCFSWLRALGPSLRLLTVLYTHITEVIPLLVLRVRQHEAEAITHHLHTFQDPEKRSG